MLRSYEVYIPKHKLNMSTRVHPYKHTWISQEFEMAPSKPKFCWNSCCRGAMSKPGTSTPGIRYKGKQSADLRGP